MSAAPATRLDVVNLQEQLDAKLQQRQARETGICPVRRELYAQVGGGAGAVDEWTCPLTRATVRAWRQVFDELIRQETINCAERGLLLLRVRDEIRMTLAAYQTLYESSVAFGMRKALQAEQGKTDMAHQVRLRAAWRGAFPSISPPHCSSCGHCHAQLEVLTGEKKDLEQQVAALKVKCDEIEAREAERRAMDERKYTEEISILKRTNQQLKVRVGVGVRVGGGQRQRYRRP